MLDSVEFWLALPLARDALEPVLDVVDRLIDFLAGLLERALRFAARKTDDARGDEGREPRDDAFPIAHLFSFVVMITTRRCRKHANEHRARRLDGVNA